MQRRCSGDAQCGMRVQRTHEGRHVQADPNPAPTPKHEGRHVQADPNHAPTPKHEGRHMQADPNHAPTPPLPLTLTMRTVELQCL